MIQDGKIFGGGLTIKFTNIANVDATGEDGDDEFIVLSSNPNVLISLYGAKGSDTFIFTPEEVKPVVSKNLRGHRGIIVHEIVAVDDVEYNGLKIRGVAVDILDNDGQMGYVSVVNDGGIYLMSEDGLGVFSFWVFPTRIPDKQVVVNIVAPAARDENPYVHVNGNYSAILTFVDMDPQEVRVTYNPEVEKLAVTDVVLVSVLGLLLLYSLSFY